jgi:hypothetical protein
VEWQKQGHVEVKCDFGVGEAAAAEAVMIEEIIKISSVFYGIDNAPLTVHLL